MLIFAQIKWQSLIVYWLLHNIPGRKNLCFCCKMIKRKSTMLKSYSLLCVRILVPQQKMAPYCLQIGWLSLSELLTLLFCEISSPNWYYLHKDCWKKKKRSANVIIIFLPNIWNSRDNLKFLVLKVQIKGKKFCERISKDDPNATNMIWTRSNLKCAKNHISIW